MKSLENKVKKYVNIKVLAVAGALLIASLIWRKYTVGILLLLFFIPLSFLTTRYSKMVPHITIEAFTSTSLFMGYAFGPEIGLFYGIAVGLYANIMNSFVNPRFLANPFLAGFAGMIAGILKGLGLGFGWAYLAAIICRTLLAYPLFGLLGTDPFERLTHQASQLFSNLIIYLPIWSALYAFVSGLI